MFEQFNNKQFVNFSKQFADTAFKAHGLAISGIERAVDLQIKAFENRLAATVEFFGEASEVRDIEAARKFFPKSVSLAKSQAESAYATTQQIVDLTLRTNEAIGELVKSGFEQANDVFAQPVVAASKKSSK
jgi:hypothetical protein